MSTSMPSVSSFPIQLIFPPQAHFTQPYLALPCLKAWMEEQGFNKVEQMDLSVESYEHFLSPRYLERAALRAEEKLDLAQFENKQQIHYDEMPAYRAALETRVSAKALVERVEAAKAVLRGDGFYDADSYLPAVRTVYNALRMVSAAHFPTALTPHNFTMRYSIERSEEVLDATLDEDENPYIAYFQSEVMPRLIARRPRLVGLSVIYGSQLIPALTLARMIKRELPDCHVTAGGGFLAYIGEKLMAATGIEQCLDSIIEHEGERPLEQLARALEANTSLDEVDSLTWFKHCEGQPRVITNLRGHPISFGTAPVPNFDGLPLEQYFSDQVVLPYDVNRGCYHSECTFCTLPSVIGPGFRSRQVSTMVDHVMALKQKHGLSNFYFVTDCMPPATLRELPKELIARGAEIHWSCDAKVERRSYQDGGAQLLFDAGCRKLLFGFETVTPRLLAMMEKGQTTADVTFVSEACSQAGISVTWYAMVGFPSETRQEAHATMEFIEEHAGMVQEVSLQTFHIDEVSEVFRAPERYGVTVKHDDQADLQLYHDYEVANGLTQPEAAELHQEFRLMMQESLPIFSGENILYFMQKSHYFLHLARGISPMDFSVACMRRELARKSRGARADLCVNDRLEFLEIPFSHSEARRSLGTRLAIAARPENQTGTFDARAAKAAARVTPPLMRDRRILIYVADQAQFVELRPDGLRALEALREAGELANLQASIDATIPSGEQARQRLDGFAGELHRLGVLVSK